MVKLFMAIPESKSSLIMLGEKANVSCWSCGTMREAHFCSACGKVQPPVPVDYFSFFGFPRKLNIDTAQFEREFYDLSRKLHPDLYARAQMQEQQWSLEQTSQLNDAYRTLKDPIKRTEYLLRLEGIELEEQSKAATEQARATGEVKKRSYHRTCWKKFLSSTCNLKKLRMQKQVGEDDLALLKVRKAQT